MNTIFVILPQTIVEVMQIVLLLLLIASLIVEIKLRKKQKKEYQAMKVMYDNLMQLPIHSVRETMRKGRSDKREL